MGWIESESVWFFFPDFADKFERREALQCLKPSGKIVGIDEVGEMTPELIMVVIMIPFDGSLPLAGREKWLYGTCLGHSSSRTLFGEDKLDTRINLAV
jgi:hypothetical protein